VLYITSQSSTTFLAFSRQTLLASTAGVEPSSTVCRPVQNSVQKDLYNGPEKSFCFTSTLPLNEGLELQSGPNFHYKGGGAAT